MKPSASELSEILSMPEHMIEDTLGVSKKTVSFDMTFGDSEDLTLLDIIANHF